MTRVIDQMRDVFVEAAQKRQESGEQSLETEQASTESETDLDLLEETEDQELEAGGDEREVAYVNDLLPEDWEAEDFYSLKLRLSDDQEPVVLGEIKDRLQGLETERAQIAQQRAELESAAQQLQQKMMTGGAALQQRTERMGKAEAELQMIAEAYPELEKDWAERQKDNPGQVALEKQQLGQRYEKAKAEYQSAATEAGQQQQAAYAQWRQQQHHILSQVFPEWSDEVKRRELQTDLRSFAAQAYGVQPQELESIDARTIAMLRDAMEYHRIKGATKGAVTKARKGQKTVLKGARSKGAGSISKQQVQQLTEQARTSRTRQDITRAMRGILAERG